MNQLVAPTSQTQDLLLKSGCIMHPVTGEIHELERMSLADIANLLDDVRALEGYLRDFKKQVSDHVLHDMDRQASWTLRAGRYELRSSSPTPKIEYDAAALHADLLELTDSGVLDRSAVEAAVQEIVDYKPRAAGINALLKLGGPIAQIINRHRTETPKQRYVSIRSLT